MNTPVPPPDPQLDYTALSEQIKHWGQQLGFQQVGITDTQLDDDEAHLLQWLAADHHGNMDYMQRHGTRRSRPAELVPGTVRVISVRMDYWPGDAQAADDVLQDTALAYLSRYALGRDYHKLIRKRLQQLATKIEALTGPFGYRAFTDSAPVLEKALAQKAGLGWILLMSRQVPGFLLASCTPTCRSKLTARGKTIAAVAIHVSMPARPVQSSHPTHWMHACAFPT